MRKQVFFAGGQPHQVAVPAKLAARHIELKNPKAHLRPDRRRHAHAAQQVVDAQQQFARLKGLGQIVIAARGKPGDAVIRVGERREHEDGNVAVFVAQRFGERKARFARHHDIKHHEIKGEAAHALACFSRGSCHRHQKFILHQIGPDQLADAAVIVNHQNVPGLSHRLSLQACRPRQSSP